MHREEAKYIKSMKTNAFVPLIEFQCIEVAACPAFTRQRT